MDAGKYVFAKPYLGWLLTGAGNTLLISLLSGLFALAAGMLLAAAGTGGRKTPMPVKLYTDVFRNIPVVPMLLLLSFGLPYLFRRYLGFSFPPGMDFLLVVTGLSLNTAAYISEILRAGLNGLPEEQYEAGITLGLGKHRTFFLILLPQAFRISFPALATRLIHNMKNSSVALVLPLNLNRMELMGQTSRIAGQTFAWAEPLLFSAAVYLVLALGLSAALNRVSVVVNRKVNANEYS